MREDLVDHRCLGAEGDHPHRVVAGGTRERVDLEDPLEERRRAGVAVSPSPTGCLKCGDSPITRVDIGGRGISISSGALSR